MEENKEKTELEKLRELHKEKGGDKQVLLTCPLNHFKGNLVDVILLRKKITLTK